MKWLRKWKIRRLKKEADSIKREIVMRKERLKPFHLSSDFTREICLDMRGREVKRIEREIEKLEKEPQAPTEDDLT